MLKHLSFRHGGINVPAADGRLLYDLILENGYKKGLEIGTSNGYSTLWIGLAFKKTGGHVITLEIDEDRGIEARENFKKAGLDNIIEGRIGDALKEIPKIDEEFDFVFIDAWKPDYKKYLDLVYPKLKKGGMITAHNVTGQGRQMSDFLDAINNDPNLETRIDHSSRSGISISIKKN